MTMTSDIVRYAMFQIGLCVCLAFPAAPATAQVASPPPLLLEGGRRLEFVRSFSSERDVMRRHAFWSKAVDFVAGATAKTSMVRPYDVITDSRGRVIVSDPGAALVHIFDFKNGRYQKLTGGGGDNFKSPIGVAVDSDDNIYVADSELGVVMVFDRNGKFRRCIGKLRGEGYFKRPTGIAVDSQRHRVYITDTLRDTVFYADLQGNILGRLGSRGSEPGELNFPTELLVQDGEVSVVDSMNFRVQFIDASGQFRGSFGRMGPVTGYLWRTKGIAKDNEGHFYLADAGLGVVQVFDREGTLLFYFGLPGDGPGEFAFPAGISIDGKDMVYVVDMMNRKVAMFQYVDVAKAGGGK